MPGGSLIKNWRTSLVRRAVFQVHLWLGVAVGLYLCVVCSTGAALLFRIDLQRAELPELFAAKEPGKVAEPASVLRAVEKMYPTGHLYGVDAPTTARPTYLAYVSEGTAFRTLLIDPSTATVLGELPERSATRALQDLHFELLAGATGTLINGIGALCLVTLALSGMAIWWQGARRWRRGFWFRWRDNAGRRLWEMHSAVGIWAFVLVGMWAVTALSFTFPKAFRSAVAAISPLTVATAPKSNVDAQDKARGPSGADAGPSADAAPPADTSSPARVTWEAVIARAVAAKPSAYVARVVLPSSPTDTIQVLFAPTRPTPVGVQDFDTLYFDQYSGAPLATPVKPAGSVGDAILKWAGPLHVAGFGGLPVKLVWLVFGLAPPLLFVTGFITWWRRVVRPAYTRAKAQENFSGAL
jgi:uncharacterized iron-regulated membrane protein